MRCIIGSVKNSSMGTLFIVATPIGNLQDITSRALDVLSSVDFIACEDTRVTSILIKKHFSGHEQEVLSKLFPFYERNENDKMIQVINMLKNDKNVALVSDAGTPTISDPGFKLVRECKALGINVVSIPGPSALLSALVSSGLPTDKFTFLGFPPLKQGHRLNLFKNLKESNKFIESTIIFYESPYKILKTLQDLKEVFGDIKISVARELTKIHETLEHKSVQEFIDKYSKNRPKGELTVLFNLK